MNKEKYFISSENSVKIWLAIHLCMVMLWIVKNVGKRTCSNDSFNNYVYKIHFQIYSM